MMRIFSAWGRTKYFGRFLPRRTFTKSSTHVIMMFLVGTLLKISLAGRSCKPGLYGHLFNGMRNFGAKLVICARDQDLED